MKFTSGDFNLNPYLLHSASIYTCAMTIVPKMYYGT